MKNNRKSYIDYGSVVAIFNPKKNKYEKMSREEAKKMESYSTENSERKNKRCKHGKTVSFEFEIGYDHPELFFLQLPEYGWMRTYDCTVAVEYKTPIYNSLRGIRPILRRIEDVNPNMDGAGTHINFGSQDFNNAKMQYLRNNFEQIFRPMDETLGQAEKRDVRKLFGRYMGDYRELLSDCNYDWGEHSNWINLQHADWIECRLPRFTTADQYMRCVNFCWEMLDIILKSLKIAMKLNRDGNYSEESDELDKLSMRLKWLFERYLAA